MDRYKDQLKFESFDTHELRFTYAKVTYTASDGRGYLKHIYPRTFLVQFDGILQVEVVHVNM